MKNFIKRFLVFSLAFIFIFSSVACGEEKEAPDYSDSNLQFNFYAYHGPTDGKWVENGVELSAGQDFRTVERFREYKEAGFTMLFPAMNANYEGEGWETSWAKTYMDRAYEGGIDKIMLRDARIYNLSDIPGGIIGEGKRFASEAELDAAVTEYMKDYRNHEAFYGVVLKDEPAYSTLDSYGQIYRSVKRVCPEAFVQCNLWPMTTVLPESYFPVLTQQEQEGLTANEIIFKRYRIYLKAFLDNTGCDYIMYDQYPMSEETIYSMFIPCLQVVTDVAKEYGVDVYNITQTLSFYQPDNDNKLRYIKEEDAYWLNNILLGFGVKQIVYYTYFPYPVVSNGWEFYGDSTFITRQGEKTELYYFMQKIMQEDQKFAPTILNFDFVTSNIYRKAPCTYKTNHVDATIKGEAFKKLESVTINKELALVTELYDDVKGNYMYMFQNLTDSIIKGSGAFQTITAQFSEEYTHAVLFEKGERRIVELDDGKLELKHPAGQATYVIPY